MAQRRVGFAGAAVGVLALAGAVVFGFDRKDRHPDEIARRAEGPEAPPVRELEGCRPPPSTPEPRGDEDPTEDDLDAWRVAVPRGTIAGIVVRGRRPITEGSVRLAEGAYDDFRSDAPSAEQRRATLAPDGTFSFSGLAPGEYWLHVAAEGVLPRTMYVRLWEEQHDLDRALVLVLGRASVEGTVYDPLGRIAGDVVVRVHPDIDSRLGDLFFVETRTAADGVYRVTDLPSGTYVAQAHLTEDPKDVAGLRSARAALADGESIRADLGSPTPEAWLRGTVLTRAGSPVEEPGTIHLLTGESEYLVAVMVPFDRAGRFEQRVPPGTYWAQVHLAERSTGTRAVETILVERTDARTDVVLRGATIHGRIRDRRTREPLAGRTDERVTWTSSIDVSDSIPLRPDGSFTIYGLPPGRYRIRGEPLEVTDASGSPVTVDVGEQDQEIDLGLEARTP